MFHVFSRRAYCLIAVGIVIGLPVYRTSDVCAQDANAASMADLQQRVQDLEAIVRQLKEGGAGNPASTQPVSVTYTDPAFPAAPPVGTLANAGAAPAAPLAAPLANAGAVRPIRPLPTAPFAGWQNGFFLESPDRTCSLRITGQIQADFRGFCDPVDTSTIANTAAAGSPTTGSPDTFLIRRARLGIEATMAKYYEFRLLPDFAGTSVAKSITDAYLNVHYWDEFQFEVGKFKQPFSYEDLIQDRYVPTMERSMMDQLVPQRDEGVMIHGERLFCGRFDYGVAISNGDSNDSTLDNNDHKDFNGRLVLRPFNDPEGCEVLRGLSFGLSGGVGVENEPLSTTSSTPPTITTPATVTWFAYNTGVIANGVRDRISPEVTYFYHSLGFASQYYQQDQLIQPRPRLPPWWTYQSTDITFWRRISSQESNGPTTASRSSRSIPLPPLRRWVRPGLGNWYSASTGLRSASRHSRTNLPSQDRALRPMWRPRASIGIWTSGSGHNSTGNMPISQAPSRSGTWRTRLAKKTPYTRGSRSSSNNSLGVRSRSIRESFRWKMPSPRIFW